MRKSLKKMLAFVLACTLFTPSTMFAADSSSQQVVEAVETVYQNSGCINEKKLTMEELRNLYNEIDQCPSDLYETVPVTGENYQLGKMSPEALKHTQDYINFIRTQAGLPETELTEELNTSAQYGALTLAMLDNGLSHTPVQPEYMTEEDYEKGYAATSSSNISYSWGYKNDQILKVAVQGQVDDEDTSNISRLGHRRWILKPQTTTFGVGNAKSASGGAFTCVRVFGEGIQSDNSVDYDFISWPASGNMLNDVFYANVPWSITVNPSRYQTPDPTKVKVELTRLSDQKKFEFNQNDWTNSPSAEQEYFNVERSGYGVSNCIIFRPIVSEIEEYSGEYEVHVTGLNDINGAAKELRYKVNFDTVVPLESISLNYPTLEMNPNGWARLYVAYHPENATGNREITWTSSNPDVATVTWYGNVDAVAPGTAVITAKVGNKTAKCTVTVKEKEIPLNAIALNKNVLTLEKGLQEKLTVIYNPSNTTEDKTATWTTDNAAVAKVDADGTVTAVSAGTAVITAKVGTRTAKCTVTVPEILPDTEDPVIHLDTLSIDKTNAAVGDTVKISVKVTDNEGIDSVFLNLKNKDNNNSIDHQQMTYNAVTDCYEYRMKITEQVVAGHWTIDTIGAFDTADNYNGAYYIWNNDEGGIWDFYVENDGVDSKAPLADRESVNIDKTEVVAGDNIRFSVKLTDNVSVEKAKIEICKESSIFGTYYDMTYNAATDRYEIVINTAEFGEGHWYVGSVWAYDAMENYSVESFSYSDDDAHWFIVANDENGLDYDCEVVNVTCRTNELPEFSYSYNRKDNVYVRVLDQTVVGYSIQSVTVTGNGDVIKEGVLTPYKEGETTIEVFNSRTDQVLKVYKVKVLSGEFEVCVGKNLELKMMSDKDQTYSAVDENNQKIDMKLIRRESSTINGKGYYADTYQLSFDTVGSKVLKVVGSVDKKERVYNIQIRNHDYSKDWTIDKEATCTEAGSKSHHCIRCDAKADITVIPKSAHVWDNGVVTKEATCTAVGQKEYTCTVCNEKKQEEIKALGHSYSGTWTIDKEATCKEEGSKSHHCIRCDAKTDITVIPKSAHSFGIWKIVTEATYSKDGLEEKICSCCSFKETRVIPKKTVTSLTLNETELRLKIAETFSLTVICKPENPSDYREIQWKSDNETVASVSEKGIITAKTSGTAVITATIGGKTAKCTVTVLVPDGWKKDGSDWYYYESGEKVTGWKQVGASWYYMYEDGKMAADTWVGDYYLDANGVWITNLRPAKWIQSGSKWWYCNEDGSYPVNCWKMIDGAWYYFDKAGYRVTGWLPDGGRWFYFNPQTGKMQTGWVLIGGNKYYMNESGVMQTGWICIGDDWYYCNASGVMQTGWLQLGTTWYYLQKNGVMMKNQWLNDTYYFGAGGSMAVGWLYLDGNYYYMAANGAKATSQWYGNYYLKEDGVMATDEWVDNGRYYVDSSGKWVPGKVK